MKKNSLAGFLVLLVVILGCSNRNNPSTSNSKKDPPPPRKLQAEVKLTRSGVSVKNTDSIDFPSLTLKLNLANSGGDDGRTELGSLPKGETVTIPYGEFTVGTTRFNSGKTKILTIFIKSGDGSSKLFLCPGSVCQPA